MLIHVSIVVVFTLTTAWAGYPVPCVQKEILPSNNSLILEEPLTYLLTDDEELENIFEHDEFQQHQFLSLFDKFNSTEWSGWSQCPLCLPCELNNTVQLRVRTEGNTTQTSARLCQGLTECYSVRRRGFWRDGGNLTLVFPLPLSPADYISLNVSVYSHDYIGYDCMWRVKNFSLTYALLTREGCYGTDNITQVLQSGLSDEEDMQAVQLLISPDCPQGCIRRGLDVCLCTTHRKALSLEEATATCNETRAVIGADQYLQDILDYEEERRNGSVWVANISNLEHYYCRSIANQSAGEIMSCDLSSETHSFYCMFADSQQFSWSEWMYVQSSCSAACNGGTRKRVRYQLVPAGSDVDVYEPLIEHHDQMCNTDICPWNITTGGTTLPPPYPTWGGCRRENNSMLFQKHEDHPILDGDKYTRQAYVEKCALAAMGLADAFMIKKRLCYIANVSAQLDSELLRSIKCSSFGDIQGAGFDVYYFSSQHATTSKMGPWTYGSCSVACGGGSQRKTRECNNPPPDEENEVCEGNFTDLENCNDDPCPSPFEYSLVGCVGELADPPIARGSSLLDGYIPGGRADATRKCALYAYRLGYVAFGIAYGGHCITSAGFWCATLYLAPSSSCVNDSGSDSSMSLFTFQPGLTYAGCPNYIFTDSQSTTTTSSMSSIITTVSTNSATATTSTTETTTACTTPEQCASSSSTTPTTSTTSSTTSTTPSTAETTGSSSPVTTTTTSVQEQLIQLKDMQEIDGDLARQEINKLVNAIDSLTTDDDKDVVLEAAETLAVIADKLVVKSAEQARELLTQLGGALSSLMSSEFTQVWAESQKFTSVLTCAETLTSKAAEKMTSPFSDTSQETLAMVINQLTPSTPGELSDGLRGVHISLPSAATQSASNESAPVAVIVYSSLSDLITSPKIGKEEIEAASQGSGSDYFISDTVVSLKLTALEKSMFLAEDIIVKIPVVVEYNADNTSLHLTCAFWNQTSGVWSSEGCRNASDEKAGYIDCRCNHTTTYAVLMRFTDEPADDSFALTIANYVGCSLSLLFLIISFIIFVYLDNLRTDRKSIHMNLIVALGLAQLMFLVGVGMTSDPIACQCIAIFLHYMFLCTFTWMLCEGIHLYHKIIAVFETGGKLRKALYYFIGWGAPLIIVAITVGVRIDGYGSETSCWLVTSGGMRAAFIAPALTIIAINFCIMVAVIRIVVKASATVSSVQEKNKVQVVKAGVRSIFILTPLLGINWLFGLFGHGDAREVFEFIFVIINTLQGLLIFIFHCVGNAEVRKAFLRKREISSRSFERSSDDKKKSVTKLSVWLFPPKDSRWPVNLATGGSDVNSKQDSKDSDVVGDILSGAVGRNLGGVKHMVRSSISDEEERRDSFSDKAPTTRGSSIDHGQSSASTVSTMLDDSDVGSKNSLESRQEVTESTECMRSRKNTQESTQSLDINRHADCKESTAGRRNTFDSKGSINSRRGTHMIYPTTPPIIVATGWTSTTQTSSKEHENASDGQTINIEDVW